MGMYNIVFGEQPHARALLAILGFEKTGDVGRFRDAFVANGEIAVYTRNGGGNREHWDDEVEEGPDCDCTGCTITYRLPQHPLYLRDKDDDFDSTYCTVYFKIPEEFKEELTNVDIGEFDPDERWQKVFEMLEKKNG